MKKQNFFFLLNMPNFNFAELILMKALRRTEQKSRVTRCGSLIRQADGMIYHNSGINNS